MGVSKDHNATPTRLEISADREPINPGLKLFLDCKLGDILQFTSLEERSKLLGEVMKGGSPESVAYSGLPFCELATTLSNFRI